MLSKRWDTAGRWCIYALLLIVFVGPFWGIVATAFSGAPVKPGELLEQGEQHPFYGLSWKLADAHSFTAEKGYTAFNELELR